jgi:E3 ubiquitin-protein ligase NRDP1
MPVYDKSRFECLSSIHDQLTCSICQGILFNPMVVPCCLQTYCSDCINEWLTRNSICPNDKSKINKSKLSKASLAMVNIINSLRLSCTYKQSGCEEVVELENLLLHLDSCDYNPNRICKNCDFKMGQKEGHDCVRNLKEKIESISSENGRIEQKILIGIGGAVVGVIGTLLVIKKI